MFLQECQMQTDYNELIPQGILFNLRQIEDMNIIKVNMTKKLIANNEIEFVKIGNKLHISRTELIRYLEENTISSIAQY
jgi:excisionase family DNA binding protein